MNMHEILWQRCSGLGCNVLKDFLELGGGGGGGRQKGDKARLFAEGDKQQYRADQQKSWNLPLMPPDCSSKGELLGLLHALAGFEGS